MKLVKKKVESMSILDIIVIAVLVLSLLIGLWRGFLRTLLNLFSNLACIVISILLAKPVTNLVKNWFNMIGSLTTKLANSIQGMFPAEGWPATGETVKNSIEGDGISKTIVKSFIVNENTYESASSLANEIGSKLAFIILMIIVAIVLFILIKIAIKILAKIFDAITKKSAISGLDRVLGGLVGLIKGCLFVFVVLSILYAMDSLPFINSWFDPLVNKSGLTLQIYNMIQDLFAFIVSKFDFPAMISSVVNA